MSSFSAVIICGLSAIGIGTVIWAIASAFVFPFGGKDGVRLFMVVRAGAGAELQPTLRGLRWLEELDIVQFKTIVVASDMEPQELKQTQLLVKDFGAELVAPSELREIIN